MTDAYHGYILPETFLDLDEVTVTPPATIDDRHRDSALEETLSREGQDEIPAAPQRNSHIGSSSTYRSSEIFNPEEQLNHDNTSIRQLPQPTTPRYRLFASNTRQPAELHDRTPGQQLNYGNTSTFPSSPSGRRREISQDNTRPAAEQQNRVPRKPLSLSKLYHKAPDNTTRQPLESHDQRPKQTSHTLPQGYHGHLTEIAAAPPADRPNGKEEQASLEKSEEHNSKTSELATRIYTLSYLVFFSIWGTLARLGIQALTTYPAAPATQGVLWANVAGSLIMGFLLEDRRIFQEPDEVISSHARLSPSQRNKNHAAYKKTIPLYIGLSTGFCGCFTSFSSWQRDSFLALANAAPTPGDSIVSAAIPRNGGYSFLALLATLILTPTLCLGALQVGAHLAIGLESITPRVDFALIHKIADPAVVLVAFLSWLGAVFLAIWPPDRPGGSAGRASWQTESWRGDAIFACVFAPLGCLTRFYVSMWLNGRLPSFPLGTFAVNIGGSILEGMFYDLQHVRLSLGIGGGRASCQVLQGLMDGYCGSTTTISTWVAEIKGLRRRHGYIYGGASMFVGLAFMIVIMGSVYWTDGFMATACGE